MVHNEYNNNVYNNARTKLLYIHRVLFCIFATWNLMEKNEDDVTTGSERTGAWMDWMDSAADVLSLHPSLLFHCSVVEVSSLPRSPTTTTTMKFSVAVASTFLASAVAFQPVAFAPRSAAAPLQS